MTPPSHAHLDTTHILDECVGEATGCGAFLLPNGHEPLGVRRCLASFALLPPLLVLVLSAATAAEKSFENSIETLAFTPVSTTRWHRLFRQAGSLRRLASAAEQAAPGFR